MIPIINRTEGLQGLNTQMVVDDTVKRELNDYRNQVSDLRAINQKKNTLIGYGNSRD